MTEQTSQGAKVIRTKVHSNGAAEPGQHPARGGIFPASTLADSKQPTQGGYVIEDVPVVVESRNPMNLPLDQMAVGQSFTDDDDSDKHAARIRYHIGQYTKTPNGQGKRFRVIREQRGTGRILRIGRVA